MDSRYEYNIYRNLAGTDTDIEAFERDGAYVLVMNNGEDYIQLELDEKQVSDIACESDAVLTPEWAIDAGND